MDYKNLGVITRVDLEATIKHKIAAAQSFGVSWTIQYSFRQLDEVKLRVLYLAFVRPHLEYKIQTENIGLKYEADTLRVQRRDTKWYKVLST